MAVHAFKSYFKLYLKFIKIRNLLHLLLEGISVSRKKMSVVMQYMLCVTQSRFSSCKDLLCSGLFIYLVGLELSEGVNVILCGVLLCLHSYCFMLAVMATCFSCRRC